MCARDLYPAKLSHTVSNKLPRLDWVLTPTPGKATPLSYFTEMLLTSTNYLLITLITDR